MHNSQHWCAPCSTRHLHNGIKTFIADKDTTCTECMACHKTLTTGKDGKTIKYTRANLTLCSTCNKLTRKPDILTLDICRHSITRLGFVPTTHDQITLRDTLITTALTTIFEQCRIPNEDLLRTMAEFLEFNSLPPNIQNDTAAYFNVTTFDPSHPHPSLSSPCDTSMQEWNTWLPDLSKPPSANCAHPPTQSQPPNTPQTQTHSHTLNHTHSHSPATATATTTIATATATTTTPTATTTTKGPPRDIQNQSQKQTTPLPLPAATIPNTPPILPLTLRYTHSPTPTQPHPHSLTPTRAHPRTPARTTTHTNTPQPLPNATNPTDLHPDYSPALKVSKSIDWPTRVRNLLS